MSFPRYPKYKPSGVEWLGDVPEHWGLSRGRHLFAQKRESAGPFDEQLSATQKFGVIPQRLFMELEDQKVMLAIAGLENFKHVQTGDFVISLRSFQGGIERSEYAGCVSPAYTVLRPTRIVEGGFWAYLLKSKGYIEALQTMTDGIRDGKNISYQQFGQIVLPDIALNEQTAIATFLDRETAKIDELVAEQRRLMELLKEKRQVVISHAVTRGLNPQAPLKPSGIAWLGDVPAHWKITRLGYYATVENGTTPDRANVEYWADGDIPWLSSGEVNQYRVTEAGEFITEKALRESSLRILPRGSVVVGMIGQGKTRGSSALLAIEATINQNLAAVIPSRSLVSDYLLHTFQAMYAYLREYGRGGNQAALNCEILSAIRIPLPDVQEQTAISDYIGQQLERFAALTAEAQRAIDLLQERRAALISAAVTGQIDVRAPIFPPPPGLTPPPAAA